MREFITLVWKRKMWLVTIWLIVMVVALVRVRAMPDVYTSSCVLMPLPLEQVEQGMQTSLRGASVRTLLAGGASSDAYAVAAFLQSGQLMDEVIEKRVLAKELFPDQWNSKTQKWLRGGPPPQGKSRRALDRHVDVVYDGFTGLLRLEVHWRSPTRAQEIASAFIGIADQMQRDSAIAGSEKRIEELRREMSNATFNEIEGFLAEEMTRAVTSLVSIRARPYYAFRVIDPPLVPHEKSWPPRFLLLVLVGTAAAGVEVGLIAGASARRLASNGRA